MGAGAIFQDDQGKILLLKPSYKDHWTIVGGGVEKDESPREACEREVEEEIGLKIKLTGLLAVVYNRDNGKVDENLQWVFAGGKLAPKQIANIKIDGKEIVDFKFVTLEKAINMVGEGMRKRLRLYRGIIESEKAVYLEDGLEVF